MIGARLWRWRRMMRHMAGGALLAGVLVGGPTGSAAGQPEHPPVLAASPPALPACGAHPALVQPVAARMAGDGRPSPMVIHALCKASEVAHADPILLLAIAWQESRFDPMARNRFSSARGLLQFTTNTWLMVMRDFGARFGFATLAAAIHTAPNGHVWVASRALRERILRLRDDPEVEAIMAAEAIDQQRTMLQQAIGRPLRPADLYLLHLLGPAGARDFLLRLARTPRAPSIDVIGRAGVGNRGLWWRDGRNLTLAQTYADLQQSLKEEAELHAGLFAPAG